MTPVGAVAGDAGHTQRRKKDMKRGKGGGYPGKSVETGCPATPGLLGPGPMEPGIVDRSASTAFPRALRTPSVSRPEKNGGEFATGDDAPDPDPIPEPIAEPVPDPDPALSTKNLQLHNEILCKKSEGASPSRQAHKAARRGQSASAKGRGQKQTVSLSEHIPTPALKLPENREDKLKTVDMLLQLLHPKDMWHLARRLQQDYGELKGLDLGPEPMTDYEAAAIYQQTQHALQVQQVQCFQAGAQLRQALLQQQQLQQSALPVQQVDLEQELQLQPQPTPKESTSDDTGGSAAKEGPVGALPEMREDKTSFVLANLPLDYNQQAMQDFLDEMGYRDLYDCVVWFPPKHDAHLKTSKAFVNFRYKKEARRFKREVAQTLMDGKKLTCTASPIQGFENNFARFWGMTRSGGSRVCPYFAKDMLDKVPPEKMKQAAGENGLMDNEATTVIVRNLPDEIGSQEAAIDFLNDMGQAKGFDFLLFVPATKKNKGSKAYVFINYCSPGLAQACIRTLHGKVLHPRHPALNVVLAKIQGAEACKAHFKETAGGKLEALVRSAEEAKNEVARPPPSFQ
eukprot:TRINITY_DN47947_c0_g1_i1.p1 TRINITY_DN47947_c0_g1~~TRINITY_DN47947_c0_g1_i1.p1  ORF type:complete len:569 (-),score=122.44 TRINITY_DN47947_c0_g1_i1:43-1749(-)